MPAEPAEPAINESRAAAGSVDRDLLYWGLGLYIASRVYLLLLFQPQVSDVLVYHNAAVRTVDLDEVVYRDFELGYPPAAYWLMVAPRLAIPGRENFADVEDFAAAYSTAYRVEMFLLDLASLALIAGGLALRRPGHLAIAVYGYTAVTLLLGHTLYDRTDMSIWFCVALWFYAWTRRTVADASQSMWTAVAFAAVGLGMAIKLVTAVMVPFLLLSEWQRRRAPRDLIIPLITLSLAAATPFLIHLPSAGLDVLTSIERHGGRGLNIDSTYASLLMLLRPLGVEMHPEYQVSAWNLESPLTPALRAAASVCLYGTFAALAVAAWLRRERWSPEVAGRIALLAPAILLCVAHVLSPQYFLWGLGVLLLLGAELLTQRQYAGWLVVLAFVATLTTFVFPYHLDQQVEWAGRTVVQPRNLVRALHRLPCTVLVLRNALFVAATAWLAWRAFPGRAAPAATPL